MSTLQEATDYAVLVYVGLMVILFFAMIAVGLVIKSKVKKAKRSLQKKVDILSNIPYISKHVIKAVKNNLK